LHALKYSEELRLTVSFLLQTVFSDTSTCT